MSAPFCPHALEMRVISLPDAKARRRQVAESLARVPVEWRFLDACTAGDPSPVEPNRAAQLERFGRELAPGEVGCFKSHLAALAEFDEHPKLDWLLVIEDDVWLDPAVDYAAVAKTADAAGIGYLRLFARTWVNGRPIASLGTRQLLYLTTDPYGTQAYLISREASERFRRHVCERTRAIVRPIDDELGRFWEHGLEIHALFPFPAIERDAPSSLEEARAFSLDRRPPKSFARWRHHVIDAAAKRLWLLRRRLRLAAVPKPRPAWRLARRTIPLSDPPT